MSNRFQDTIRLVREVVAEAFREYQAEEADAHVAARVAEVLNRTFSYTIYVDIVFVEGKFKLAFFSTDTIGYGKGKKLGTVEEVADWLINGRTPSGG